MKIILFGGGTLGSVCPLIGIWQSLKKKDDKLDTLFIGTKSGPEKNFISKYNIPFKSISSGKLRRYFSFQNVIDLFKIEIAFWQSIYILFRFKPDVIISAGSFVAVPLIWASKFFKTKVILYQPDLVPGLANKLNQNQANYIYTAFSDTTKYYPKNKVKVAGTVLRHEIKEVNSKLKTENLRLLILGGGTGSESINQLIKKSINQLNDYQITHVTGKGKGVGRKTKEEKSNYESVELLTDDYYQKIAEADLVVSRAGLSTLMELSYLLKPTILIPLPDSPQEQNAYYFCELNAAVCLPQKSLTTEKFIKAIKNSDDELITLGKNLNQAFTHGGEELIAQKIYELMSF